MGMEIKIRTGYRSDLEQLMQLWLSGNRQAHQFVAPDYWEAHYNSVRDMLPEAKVFVAEDADRQIAGFVGIQGRCISGLFVAEHYRSKGIGKALLERCKREFPCLKLQVYAKNERAFRFYQREGFLITRAQVDPEAGAMEYHMAWTSMYDQLKERRALEC